MASPNILALDPSTVATGWANSHGDYGVWHLLVWLEDEDAYLEPDQLQHVGAPAVVLQRFIGLHIENAGIELIAYEQVIAGANRHGLTAQWYLQAAIQMAACEMEIPTVGYWPTNVKKRVTGDGRAEKEEVLEVVRDRLGVGDVTDTDAADAMAVLLCPARFWRHGRV